MLLNLGLTADAAAAHNPDPSVQPETPPAPASPSYSSAFSLASLPLLGPLCSRPKQTTDAATQSTGPTTSVAMSPIASDSDNGQSSQIIKQPLSRPSVTRANTATNAATTANRKASRKKTSYQLAHPASHARHKRLKLRPRLLLQLQQISDTPRPLPILDILPSTLYMPRLARKFPAMFRGKNGLGPNDLIIVMSELYELAMQRSPNVEAEDHDHRELVATICQILQEDALQKGKAEICLNFGPVWEATPLPSGSYEFVARTENGPRVMRWALRAGKNRRYSAQPSSEPREDNKRFTFSLIDPNSRQHPVIASMTRNQLEVYDQYSALVRSGTGPTTPSSNMSVISDLSDNEVPLDTNTNANVVTIDDELRTLIIITSIWVAFREGWSHNFSYGDPIASPTKSVSSPATAKYNTSTVNSENNSPVDRDELNELKEIANGGNRCVSVSSMRRSNTMSPVDGGKSFGSLNRRSNSTGAAFMDRVRQRSVSSTSHRFNRHSMFTSTGENGGVVSRPASIRQNSVENKDTQTPQQPKNKSKTKTTIEPPKSTTPKPDKTPPSHPNSHQLWDSEDTKEPAIERPHEGKGRHRHRFSSLFTIFHRKNGAAH